jgi:hypothetical protein
MDAPVTDKRVYQKGDIVYIAGTMRDNSFREVEVFTTFMDECELQYVLRYYVPGIGEVMYEVRDWGTISETKHGPLNMWTESRMAQVMKMFKIVGNKLS